MDYKCTLNCIVSSLISESILSLSYDKSILLLAFRCVNKHSLYSLLLVSLLFFSVARLEIMEHVCCAASATTALSQRKIFPFFSYFLNQTEDGGSPFLKKIMYF